MKRLLMMLLAIGLLGCSGSPETKPDAPLTDQPKESTDSSGDPLAVALAWSTGTQAKELGLGDGAVVERMWSPTPTQYIVLLSSSPDAGKGEGEAVAVTVDADGQTWSVTSARKAPASTLWPGI